MTSIEEHQLRDTAIALYGGGWRPEDTELMADNYAIPIEEAKKVCEVMQGLIDDGVLTEAEE